MKLLLILNEQKKGSHDDIYSALNDLVSEEALESYKVIPFLEYLANAQSPQDVFNKILETTKEFPPDFILWSHTTKLKIAKSDLSYLRKILPDAIMGYWDGDIYQSPYKKLPSNIIHLCQFCDVIFCQGVGAMTDKLKKVGCENIRYVPAATSVHRFKEADSSRKIEYDIVMIGNRIIRKNPFLTMPGTRLRIKLVKKFYQEFGNRFAVYGSGWKGEYAKGPLPFSEQAKAYQKSRLVLGNNNLHADYYFSNRLPIAISSGTPVLYHQEKGVQEVFPEEVPFWFSNPDEALEKAKNLLQKSQTELDVIGKKGRTWVTNNMSTNNTFSYMIRAMKELQENQTDKIDNPWINKKSI